MVCLAGDHEGAVVCGVVFGGLSCVEVSTCVWLWERICGMQSCVCTCVRAHDVKMWGVQLWGVWQWGVAAGALVWL